MKEPESIAPGISPSRSPEAGAPASGRGTLPFISALLFILAFARDMIVLFVLIIGSAIASTFAIQVSGAFAVVMVFPLLGIAGCSLAALVALQRKNHSLGVMAGAVGVAGSSFPGLLVVGPVGLLLSLAGLAVLIYAKGEFSEEDEASPPRRASRTR